MSAMVRYVGLDVHKRVIEVCVLDAAARKLVVIAWHMLTHNEPYRYAVPRITEDKLRALWVQATGEKRKTGPKRGEKNVAKLPGGGRTIKSLARVCQEEQLPEPSALSPGEQRMVAESGAAEFVASLASDQVIPRRRATGGARPNGRTPQANP
jgi:hypothetical protein